MDFQHAQERVKVLKGFYMHLSVYIIVIGFLFLINYISGSNWWFYWPALAWGVAITLHAITVFFEDSVLGTNWEEHKIKELMGKSTK